MKSRALMPSTPPKGGVHPLVGKLYALVECVVRHFFVRFHMHEETCRCKATKSNVSAWEAASTIIVPDTRISRGLLNSLSAKLLTSVTQMYLGIGLPLKSCSSLKDGGTSLLGRSILNSFDSTRKVRRQRPLGGSPPKHVRQAVFKSSCDLTTACSPVKRTCFG